MIIGEDRFKLHFYGTMYDEKRVRIIQGMGEQEVTTCALNAIAPGK